MMILPLFNSIKEFRTTYIERKKRFIKHERRYL
jgi:hypothetical protein